VQQQYQKDQENREISKAAEIVRCSRSIRKSKRTGELAKQRRLFDARAMIVYAT